MAKIYAEIERARSEQLAEQTENVAARYLQGIELSVLGAMVTRYSFELFSELELADFHQLTHRAVFTAIRALETAGENVDGEFLLDDIAAEVESSDREHDKHVREKVTDAFLRSLVSPPRYVVPCREPSEITSAICQLKAAALARTNATTSVEVLEHMTLLLRAFSRPKPNTPETP